MSYRKDEEKGMDCYDNNPLELDANAFATWFFDALFFGKTEPSGALTKERIKDYRSLYGRKVGKLRREPLDDLLNAIPLKYTEFIVCDE